MDDNETQECPLEEGASLNERIRGEKYSLSLRDFAHVKQSDREGGTAEFTETHMKLAALMQEKPEDREGERKRTERDSVRADGCRKGAS